MKISYHWLKKYLDIDLPAEEVARVLTNCGLEVENLEMTESVKGGLKGVFIGEVKTCIKHPQADHLSITTVDVGEEEPLSIVCGAPNVKAGQKVPVAKIGTILYKDDQPFAIKAAKIRGEMSQGMICAEDELGLGPSHEGIMELNPDATVGMPASEYFQIKEEAVFEIGLTPNRTDAMSHMGVARDLLAALKSQHTLFSDHELLIPSVESFQTETNDLPVQVIVEDPQACPRYSGVSMTGVSVEESPEWLKKCLIQAGIRPINNLVDIGNFVMLETGQPLHFFDADVIRGQKVVVRKLPAGTLFVTLDEVKRELTGDDLMICDAGQGMCIAGVFGGIQSGVSERTRRIFIESAHFDPRTIRKTSKHHGLQTDSSFRFERGVDPNGTIYALKRAALLVKELAGGRIASEIVDVYPLPIQPCEITIRYAYIDRLIGKRIPRKQIMRILASAGMRFLQQDDHTLTVSVPTYKMDVKREADLVEEILRLYGYNNVEVPAGMNTSVVYWRKPDKGRIREVIAEYLTSQGFYEIMTNSLTNPDYYTAGPDGPETCVEIINPLSRELRIMRQTLLFGGLEAILYNINRKNPDIRFFEFGKIYRQAPDQAKSNDVLQRFKETDHLSLLITGRLEPEHWRTTEKTADIYHLKAIVMNIFQRLGISPGTLALKTCDHPLFKQAACFSCAKGIVVQMGMLHDKVLARFDIKQAVCYAEVNWDLLLELVRDSGIGFSALSRFPEVRRDLALLIPAEIRFEEIEKLAFQVEKRLLKRIRLFDIYEGEKIGEGKKSYAISFFLQDEEKTLTDTQIEQVMQQLMKTFEDKLQAVIR